MRTCSDILTRYANNVDSVVTMARMGMKNKSRPRRKVVEPRKEKRLDLMRVNVGLPGDRDLGGRVPVMEWAWLVWVGDWFVL